MFANILKLIIFFSFYSIILSDTQLTHKYCKEKNIANNIRPLGPQKVFVNSQNLENTGIKFI